MADPVEYWQRELAERVGVGAAQRAEMLDRLLAYCARHGVDPSALPGEWLDHPELTVRRRPDATQPPNTAVESFLVHNGVNVFGDIVCVAGRPEELAKQGGQFVPQKDGSGPA